MAKLGLGEAVKVNLSKFIRNNLNVRFAIGTSQSVQLQLQHQVDRAPFNVDDWLDVVSVSARGTLGFRHSEGIIQVPLCSITYCCVWCSSSTFSPSDDILVMIAVT
jgi:hypothetical protein